MEREISIGTLVRVVGMPTTSELTLPETRAAFEAALGRTFAVAALADNGWLELELGPELDARLGGFMNTIWIEPEHVEIVTD